MRTPLLVKESEPHSRPHALAVGGEHPYLAEYCEYLPAGVDKLEQIRPDCPRIRRRDDVVFRHCRSRRGYVRRLALIFSGPDELNYRSCGSQPYHL